VVGAGSSGLVSTGLFSTTVCGFVIIFGSNFGGCSLFPSNGFFFSTSTFFSSY